jgi:hypothetical protein
MDALDRERELGNLVAWARERRTALLEFYATPQPDASVEQVLQHLENLIASYQRSLS